VQNCGKNRQFVTEALEVRNIASPFDGKGLGGKDENACVNALLTVQKRELHQVSIKPSHVSGLDTKPDIRFAGRNCNVGVRAEFNFIAPPGSVPQV
jgi:hypothetical protein